MPKYNIQSTAGATETDYVIEADGHFFSKDAETLGYLILVKSSIIVAIYREFSNFFIDQSTLTFPTEISEAVLAA